MLLRSDFEAHGWTQRCNLCWRMQNGRGIGGVHSEACRARMEAALRQSDQGRARTQRAAERFAHQVEDDEANEAAFTEPIQLDGTLAGRFA